MIDLWTRKVTLYRDVPKQGGTPRHFERRIINKCYIETSQIDSATDTVKKDFSGAMVITKDVNRYKATDEYMAMSQQEQMENFTVSVGDFVVLKEVADSVANATEFADLQTRYRACGVKIMSVKPFIFGMATDNIVLS